MLRGAGPCVWRARSISGFCLNRLCRDYLVDAEHTLLSRGELGAAVRRVAPGQRTPSAHYASTGRAIRIGRDSCVGAGAVDGIRGARLRISAPPSSRNCNLRTTVSASGSLAHWSSVASLAAGDGSRELCPWIEFHGSSSIRGSEGAYPAVIAVAAGVERGFNGFHGVALGWHQKCWRHPGGANYCVGFSFANL